MDTTTSFGISGAGLTGTLRFTWVTDSMAHVIDHADADEPSGTWTGLACPDHGLAIGTDVDLQVLKHLSAQGQIADLLWDAPDDITRDHNDAFFTAMSGHDAGHTEAAEGHWQTLQAIWSRAWDANYKVLEFMQQAGIERFGLVKPQRWAVASFEHHCGPHGVERPHIHNLVIPALTRVPA